jgi:hypothetical protein
VPAPVVISLESEEQRTWTSSLAMKLWQPPLDPVRAYDEGNSAEKRGWIIGKITPLTGKGYGIHYPIRHGQIENWV